MKSTPGREKTISKLTELTEAAGGTLILPKAVTVDEDFLGAIGTAKVTRIRYQGGELDLGNGGMTAEHLSDEDLDRLLKAANVNPTTLVITARKNLDGSVSAAFARIYPTETVTSGEIHINDDNTARDTYSSLTEMLAGSNEIAGFTVANDLDLIMRDAKRRKLKNIHKALRKEASGLKITNLISRKTVKRHWRETQKDETPADVCEKHLNYREMEHTDLSSVKGLTAAAVSCLKHMRQHEKTDNPQDQMIEIKIIGSRDYEEVRADCHAVKTAAPGDEVFKRCARRIAESIGTNCILVPIPSHTGRATDTLTLAKAIRDALAEKSLRAPVIDGLECDPHESLCELKHTEGGDTDKVEILMRVTESILYEYLVNNTPVYLVDNVVDTGKTARAALKALPTNGVIAIGYTEKHKTEI